MVGDGCLYVMHIVILEYIEHGIFKKHHLKIKSIPKWRCLLQDDYIYTLEMFFFVYTHI